MALVVGWRAQISDYLMRIGEVRPGWRDEVPIRPLNGETRQIRTFSVITAQPNMRLNPSDTPLPLYL
jgi:hypothetical protein